LGVREPHLFFSAESSELGEDSSAVQARGKGGIEFQAFQSWFKSLSFQEALAWAYGCSKSELREVYWRDTFEDIQLKLRFKVGEKQVEGSQMYEAIANVASQIFGNSEAETSSSSKGSLSQAKVPEKNVVRSSHEAIKLFSDIFGRG